MNNKGILKLRYEICSLSATYRTTERIWEDGLFQYSLKIDGNVYLEISKKDICIDELKNTIEIIDQQSEVWLCIYKIKSYPAHSEAYLFQKTKIRYEIKEISRTFIVTRKNIDILIENSIKPQMPISSEVCSYSQLPEFPDRRINLNEIDSELKRQLIYYIETKKLSSLYKDYPDDMLKRWFIVLEYYKEFQGKDIDNYRDVKSVRNFVSHPLCDKDKNLISLIEAAGLHSAICTEKGKPAARFDRKNQEHIEFVQRYAGLASARVRYILEQELGGTYAVENSAESCSLSAFF